MSRRQEASTLLTTSDKCWRCGPMPSTWTIQDSEVTILPSSRTMPWLVAHGKIMIAKLGDLSIFFFSFFVEIFPELVAPAQVPLHIAYPNAPATEMPTPAVPTLNVLAPNLLAAAAVTATQRRMNATGGDPTGVIGGNRGATGPGVVAGAGGGAAARQDSFFSWSRWHKWLAIFLLFAYLLVAKTISRASSSSGHPNW